MHPTNTSYQHILSSHPINTFYQHILSIHHINTSCQHILPTHVLTHSLSTHPLNPLSLSPPSPQLTPYPLSTPYPLFPLPLFSPPIISHIPPPSPLPFLLRYVQKALVELLDVVIDVRQWEASPRSTRGECPDTGNTSTPHHTLSMHPFDTPCQYSLSTHPVNTPSQHTPSHPTPSHHPLSPHLSTYCLPIPGGWECIHKGPLHDMPVAAFGTDMTVKGETLKVPTLPYPLLLSFFHLSPIHPPSSTHNI